MGNLIPNWDARRESILRSCEKWPADDVLVIRLPRVSVIEYAICSTMEQAAIRGLPAERLVTPGCRINGRLVVFVVAPDSQELDDEPAADAI